MIKKVDVLLINPGSNASVYQGLSNEFSAIEPPFLAAAFATYFRRNNCTVDIIDASALNLNPQQTANLITKNYISTLIVLVVYGFQPSASTHNMVAAGEICTALKDINPESKIMITGTHPAALPKKTLQEEDVDFVCSQEGPQTILQTILALKAGINSFENVPGLWYERDGFTIATDPGPLLDNLDEAMPYAAWDLLPMDKYRAHNWHCFEHIYERRPYASIYTSLGCPYKCSFCCINAPFGKPSYRTWSPQVVIEQIDILVNKYGVKNIKFIDEMFVLKKEHLEGICDLIVDKGYDLNIWAYARVDTIKDGFLPKLKAAGIRWLALGIESGSKHVRDGVAKGGHFGVHDILATVKKIQDAGINVIGNYIFGLPDDTYKSMSDTLELAIEANCEFANFYCAMAYPGSKLYDIAVHKELELPETWLGYSQHAYETKPLATDSLTAAEVLKFRDEAFHKYFTNPRYLDMVRNKFGKDVEAHIKEMTRVKLRRKILEDIEL